MSQKIRITPVLFEYALRVSVVNGITSLQGIYLQSIKGVQASEIVNADFFEDKAVEWLKNEVYARTLQGKKCTVFEMVTVQREQDGRVTLQNISAFL